MSRVSSRSLTSCSRLVRIGSVRTNRVVDCSRSRWDERDTAPTEQTQSGTTQPPARTPRLSVTFDGGEVTALGDQRRQGGLGSQRRERGPNGPRPKVLRREVVPSVRARRASNLPDVRFPKVHILGAVAR